MTSATTFRTPYDQRVELVKDIIKTRSQVGNTLYVLRGGAKAPYSYAPGKWTDGEGDQRKSKKPRLWG